MGGPGVTVVVVADLTTGNQGVAAFHISINFQEHPGETCCFVFYLQHSL